MFLDDTNNNVFDGSFWFIHGLKHVLVSLGVLKEKMYDLGYIDLM